MGEKAANEQFDNVDRLQKTIRKIEKVCENFSSRSSNVSDEPKCESLKGLPYFPKSIIDRWLTQINGVAQPIQKKMKSHNDNAVLEKLQALIRGKDEEAMASKAELMAISAQIVAEIAQKD